MHHTKAELTNLQQTGVYLLEKQIEAQQLSLNEICKKFPGLVHFNCLDTFKLINATFGFENYFNLTISEIINQGARFTKDYFHESTLEVYIPELIAFGAKKDSNAVIGQFHKVRKCMCSEYHTFMSLTKICSCHNCFITVQIPIDIFGKNAVKLESIIDDSEFIRKNITKYQLLTKREIEILQMLGKGKSRNQIVDELCISKHTFDTHRKSIREKLEIKNPAQLYKYIHVFGWKWANHTKNEY